MRIILYEMKKIWDWKIIALLIIIATLFYQMFLYYPVEHFRHNHPHIEGHDLTVKMTGRYGTNITEEEFEEFIAEKKFIYELQMDTYLAADELSKEAGITNTEEYQNFINDYFNETLSEDELELVDKIWLDEQLDNLNYQVQAVNYLEEVVSFDEGSNGILDNYLFESTMNYTKDLAILVILLTLIFVAPLLVSDRSRNIHFLQYTSKNGRKILSQQLIGIVLSAFLLTTINIVGFGRLILRNDLLVFWNNDIRSFLNLGMTNAFYDLTFGEYLSIAIFFIYLLSISISLIAFALSRYSQNKITLVMKAIPVYAVFAIVCYHLFNRMLSPFNRFYHLTNLVGVEVILLSLILITGISIVIFTLRKEKQLDIY